MASPLNRPVTRLVESFRERGRPIVAKMTDEGIYIKRKGERWSSAVLCPWAAAFSTACKIKARHDAEEKKKRRLVRRGVLSLRAVS